jgi:hypothetical protein
VHFVQTADIDASETREWNEGSGFTPIGYFDVERRVFVSFEGIYDGAGYSITNLFMYAPPDQSQKTHLGLFGIASNATIRNVNLLDVDITGNFIVGGIVGMAMKLTVIQNSNVSGRMTGFFSHIGGIVGSASGSDIIDCTSAIDIEVEYGATIGGIVAVIMFGTRVIDPVFIGNIIYEPDFVIAVDEICGFVSNENEYTTPVPTLVDFLRSPRLFRKHRSDARVVS